VLGSDAMPNLQQYMQLPYITRCVCESMRLYPHPPVLLRRAKVPDVLPGGYEVRRWGVSGWVCLDGCVFEVCILEGKASHTPKPNTTHQTPPPPRSSRART